MDGAAAHGAGAQHDSASHAPSRALVIAAFAAVYIIWGSTYLAIRFAIETIPPFLMAGVRFLIAGTILYVWARARGVARPVRGMWVSATIVGALLMLGGNGAVVWAEQSVPSGVASLLAGTTPLWMVGFDWARGDGERPRPSVFAGLALGLAGIAVLVGPSHLGGGGVSLVGAVVLLIGSLAWATGSLYSRYALVPRDPFLATGMQMLAGGVLLVIAGLATGEQAQVHLAHLSLKSVLAFSYLVVFGALVGFTAYLWLLRVSTTARVSTYAYVNPVVAVVLGWAFAGEPLTARTLVAAAVIVAAVVLITTGRRIRPPSSRPAETGPDERASPAVPSARSRG
ncbi:MAG TPA: drug/metabolite exporter YedA [Gemmatimonadaceae bacterium]|nr:drug/metabolite exporter YedA [Gemmatimonadaceae bacterium]